MKDQFWICKTKKKRLQIKITLGGSSELFFIENKCSNITNEFEFLWFVKQKNFFFFSMTIFLCRSMMKRSRTGCVNYLFLFFNIDLSFLPIRIETWVWCIIRTLIRRKTIWRICSVCKTKCWLRFWRWCNEAHAAC